MSLRDDYKSLEQSYMLLRDQYSDIARALGFPGVGPWDDPIVEHADIIARAQTGRGTRYFIDVLTATGDLYLIPADRRQDWDEFDIRCEETHELLPVPAWARAVEQLSWIEFERPEEVFK